MPGFLAVVLILVPVAILFGQSWGAVSTQIDAAEKERQGVEYAIALGELTRVVAEAQSAALHQRPALEPVTGAVAALAAVDARLGADLKTSARWTDARGKIEALAGNDGADPAATYAAYASVTDLLLALHEEVRDNSGLSRDPQGDTYHLQAAGASELPVLVVGTGRLADLAGMAVGAPETERAQLLGRILATRTLLERGVADLTDDLQASLDETESDSLSTKLLTGLNRFRQGVDKLYVVAAGAEADTAMAAQLVTAQGEAHTAQAELMATVLTELDVLLTDRIDRLGMRRTVTFLALTLALLIAVAPVVVPLVRQWVARRRASERRRPFGETPAAPVEETPPRFADALSARNTPRHADDDDEAWVPRRRRSSVVR